MLISHMIYGCLYSTKYLAQKLLLFRANNRILLIVNRKYCDLPLFLSKDDEESWTFKVKIYYNLITMLV